MKTEELLHQRASVHGNAVNQFSVAQELKRTFEHWLRQNDFYISIEHSIDGQMIKEGLDMTATKLSRILVGDCTFDDHWRDIGGYNTIVANHFKKEEK